MPGYNNCQEVAPVRKNSHLLFSSCISVCGMCASVVHVYICVNTVNVNADTCSSQRLKCGLSKVYIENLSQLLPAVFIEAGSPR